MAKSKSGARKKLIEATLKLAASQAWHEITLVLVAKAAKISAAEAGKNFASTDELLAAIVQYIDGQVQASIGKPLHQGTPHDRLFEVMMARFDALQSHRKAILQIIAAVKHDPSLARVLIPAQIKSMQKMLELAGLNQDGAKEIIAAAGLLALYALSLHHWQQDTTKDMAGTMAALDRNLSRAGKLAEILFRTF